MRLKPTTGYFVSVLSDIPSFSVALSRLIPTDDDIFFFYQQATKVSLLKK